MSTSGITTSNTFSILHLKEEILDVAWDKCISLEGILVDVPGLPKAHFSPEEIKNFRGPILYWMGLLPEIFRQAPGGALSDAICIGAQSRKWTDSIRSLERLLTLGAAAGRVRAVPKMGTRSKVHRYTTADAL